MARKTTLLTIQENNPAYRDNAKVFLLTEMSADHGERWANRLIVAIANAGGDLPDGIMGGGMAGLSALGMDSIFDAAQKIKFETLEPLLDEMMGCVQTRVGQNPWQAIVRGVNCQIEEIQTFWTLRKAWVELEVGFSFADAARKLVPAASAESSLPNTPTSPDSSGPS
jgi:predicted NBD/HSP70 family sugar kinase